MVNTHPALQPRHAGQTSDPAHSSRSRAAAQRLTSPEPQAWLPHPAPPPFAAGQDAKVRAQCDIQHLQTLPILCYYLTLMRLCLLQKALPTFGPSRARCIRMLLNSTAFILQDCTVPAPDATKKALNSCDRILAVHVDIDSKSGIIDGLMRGSQRGLDTDVHGRLYLPSGSGVWLQCAA